MQKIFEEAASEMHHFKRLYRSRPDCAIEHIQVAGRGIMPRRKHLILAIACIAAEIEANAEAESAQFREQARALLVAGHAAGFAWLDAYSHQIRLHSHHAESGASNFVLVAEPEQTTVESLACVLQARKAKP